MKYESTRNFKGWGWGWGWWGDREQEERSEYGKYFFNDGIYNMTYEYYGDNVHNVNVTCILI